MSWQYATAPGQPDLWAWDKKKKPHPIFEGNNKHGSQRRLLMNDELKRWIEDTEAKATEANAMAAIMLEAAKRAREGEDPREFILYFRKPLRRLPGWQQPAIFYTLKPRRRLRAWTAKEWGARIGDEFLVCGCKSVLKTVNPFWLMFDTGDDTIYTSNKSDMETITQLDGSPCGEWEEVQP